MLTIAKLFGKSPFAPLKTHMEKVDMCVKELPKLLVAIDADDKGEVEKLVKHISKLEHEADLTKNDIRNHLPKSIFLPIERSRLLEILTLQDSLADQAEDIAVVFSLHELKEYKKLKEKFTFFFHENVESVFLVNKIVMEIEQLIESTFGGVEAQKVREMIDSVCLKEHEIDILQYDLLKTLYSVGNSMDHPSFYHWVTVIKEVGALSNIAENLANRIRMVLEIK